MLSAMQEFLPDEWQNLQACEARLSELRERYRVPPGGRRWPDTDPRRIAAAGEARGKVARDARNAVSDAWSDLRRTLVDGLRSGGLIAYAVPTTPGEAYHQIPRSLWDSLRIASLRDSTVSGSVHGSVKILIGHAGPDEGKSRATGRPRSEARPVVVEAYRRRLMAGEALSGAHREAAELIRILRDTHPEIKALQKSVAKWVLEEMRACDQQRTPG